LYRVLPGPSKWGWDAAKAALIRVEQLQPSPDARLGVGLDRVGFTMAWSSDDRGRGASQSSIERMRKDWGGVLFLVELQNYPGVTSH
jgi:hypothetical protein